MKKDIAFSGLEAAIVLIAFVVVAAVFSYVMLGAGFFATQKSQEVTYSGIKQATSNLVMDGNVYGDSSPVANVIFSIGIAEGGQPQLLSGIKFVTTSSAGATPVEASVTFQDKYGAAVNANTVLSPGSKVQVTVPMTPNVANGQTFTIEMKPAIGASSLISRTISTGFTKGILI